jgi:hypothetical protein
VLSVWYGCRCEQGLLTQTRVNCALGVNSGTGPQRALYVRQTVRTRTGPAYPTPPSHCNQARA